MALNLDKIIAALKEDSKDVVAKGRDFAEDVKNDPAKRNVAIGAGAGVLGGLLLANSGGKFWRNAAGAGAVAALGGLAYYAWKKHEGAAPDAAPAEAPAGFLPPPGNEAQFHKSVLAAMVGAAKADGQVTSDERGAIFERLGQVELEEDEQDLLFSLLASPVDMDMIAAGATTPEAGAQIYTAALVTAGGVDPSERKFLDDLARKVGVSPELAAEIEAAAKVHG
jgi:uncharacterized membrane protein YebE (DUF533 family)